MTETAIIIGDLHLGKSSGFAKTNVGGGISTRVADQVNLLNWTLERCDELCVGHIIITGDVFEEPKPHPSIIAILIAWLKKCQTYGIFVHIILGNHDMLRSGSVFTSPLDIISEIELDNITVYKQTNTIFIGTTAFTFLPFRDRKCFSVTSNAEAINIITSGITYELAGIPSTYRKVVVGHMAIEGSIPIGDEFDDVANELYCPISMFNGYDYVWMGHVHRPQVMNKESPYIAHIGSMDISNFGETEHKKHIVIFDCNVRENNFTIEYLPTRSLKHFSISVPKEIEDTTAYVIEELKKTEFNFKQAIVRMDVSLSSPELISVNKGLIEKFLNQQGVFNVTGISETKKTVSIKKEGSALLDTTMDVATTIKAFSEKHVEENMRTDYIDLSMDIYNQFKLDNKDI